MKNTANEGRSKMSKNTTLLIQESREKSSDRSFKKLIEFDVLQIFLASDKQKDATHTKRQFCVYGTYYWEKMKKQR